YGVRKERENLNVMIAGSEDESGIASDVLERVVPVGLAVHRPRQQEPIGAGFPRHRPADISDRPPRKTAAKILDLKGRLVPLAILEHADAGDRGGARTNDADRPSAAIGLACDGLKSRTVGRTDRPDADEPRHVAIPSVRRIGA